MSNIFSEKLIESENKISTIYNKLEELIENKSSYVWSNKLDENSIIDSHKTYLSLNYDPNNINYKTESFYIFKDKQGTVIPYYCWKIKYINYCLSNVKFIALIQLII